MRIKELSEKLKERRSTIKYYSDIGILPFNQKDKRLIRDYNFDEIKERLKEIRKLKIEGLSLEEIVEKLK
jgi:DNA-binding transcriptional MerR regulator